MITDASGEINPGESAMGTDILHLPTEIILGYVRRHFLDFVIHQKDLASEIGNRDGDIALSMPTKKRSTSRSIDLRYVSIF